jgi:hypothetical protein
MSEGINPETKNKNNMNASILTSDRYIAIKSAHGLTFNKTLRILQKGGTIIPARWNEKNERLESVAINQPSVPIFMYSKSRKIEAKLVSAGINFEWLNLDQAESLTS